jgi:hypothetical protein
MNEDDIINGPDDTLLVDRRKDIPGPGLHALIIGVSRYADLPEPAPLLPRDNPADPRTFGLTQVKTPATSAWKIAQWIRDRYNNPEAPLKTLRLLVSSSAEELAGVNGLPGVSTAARRANKANVWQAMLRWKKDCLDGGAKVSSKNISMFYASGHGVQWDKDGGMVLLEDFAGKELPVDFSISFSGVHEGMSGSDMPQTQLYFADACRIRPDAARYVKDGGRGLQFRIPQGGGEELRSAPIYFAAAPQGYAKGVLKEGTFFSSALVECLDSLAVSEPTNDINDSLAASHWHVKVESLLQPLSARVTSLEAAKEKDQQDAVRSKEKDKQHVVLGGRTRPSTFHVLPQPPPVTLMIDVDPDDIAQLTHAELIQNGLCVRGRAISFPRPLTWPDVQAGLYILNLHRDGAPIRQVPIRAKPLVYTEKVQF